MPGCATQKPPADQRHPRRHNSSWSFFLAGVSFRPQLGRADPWPRGSPSPGVTVPCGAPRLSERTGHAKSERFGLYIGGEIRIIGPSTTLVLGVDFVPAALSYDFD
ncbi:unnamed protein product [Rangifer tarandus platyrhynchus]|uniref:Uncharacterized protein n=1 Tax=Rangifer tarandus platyrhynchus TaxID=3082113 RepID=A0ABN9A5J5_RANTA|nr:unnamed protein product [Rangifer tarandus platyrhynchus]